MVDKGENQTVRVRVQGERQAEDEQRDRGPTVAVVGGTGTIGRLIVAELAARGAAVIVLSRTPAENAGGGSASHRRVDLGSGEGLSAALQGVDVAIDASNALGEARQVLVEGTGRLLRAEAEAGVGHHIGISIVGCDRVPTSYYRAKVAQEEAIASGPVPWSLLRATQFHPFVAWLLGRGARARVLPTGAALLQPIDPAVVAGRVADAAETKPGGRLAEVAGPEVHTLTELAHSWRRAEGRRLLPVRVPLPGRLGRALREGGLCNREAATAGPTFEQWLARG